jgi:hypothetical protein
MNDFITRNYFLLKRSAEFKIRRAVCCGKIIKPKSCPMCGVVGFIKPFHKDLLYPMEFEWLCESCYTSKSKELLLNNK